MMNKQRYLVAVLAALTVIGTALPGFAAEGGGLSDRIKAVLAGYDARNGAGKEETGKDGKKDVPAELFVLPEKTVDNMKATWLMDGATVARSDRAIHAFAMDRSVVLAKHGAAVVLERLKIDKGGDTTSEEGGRHNGQNAAVLAVESKVKLDGSSVSYAATGAAAVAVVGTDGNVTVRRSRLSTAGKDSPAVAVLPAAAAELTDSELVTRGRQSACLYSAGSVTVAGTKGFAAAGPIAVLKDGGRISLEDSSFSGTAEGVMLDGPAAEGGEASFEAKHTRLENTGAAPLFRVGNMTGHIYLENTVLLSAAPAVVAVCDGGALTLATAKQSWSGNVVADKTSTVMVSLQDGAVWTGTMNGTAEAEKADVNLDRSSQWILTGPSHVTVLSDADRSLQNIRSGGYDLYYDRQAAGNDWLHGRTLDLPGGGQLLPQPVRDAVT